MAMKAESLDANFDKVVPVTLAEKIKKGNCHSPP